MCVTPSPAHVSLAAMFAGWMTTVPLGVPQATTEVTVSVADPDLLASALLIAVMV
jgi:hypothetical protein